MRRPAWVLFWVALATWLAIAGLLLALPARGAATIRESRNDVLVVTTANILADLGPAAAAADLHRAMAGSDVVLAQEMAARRLDAPGWARAQSRAPYCSETPVYWRTAALVRLSWRSVVIQRGTWPGATRCVTLVRLRERTTGRVFVVINVHQAQHVELGGRPRPGRAAVYARGMARLDQLRAGLVVPYLIGGDWNVDRRADARVRWHGFPHARLTDLRATRTRGTLGNRQVDYVLYGPAWRSLGARRITGTRSDHNFVRARLEWRPWTC
jgi:hypothetical protein